MKKHEQGNLVSFCALFPCALGLAVGRRGVAGQRDWSPNRSSVLVEGSGNCRMNVYIPHSLRATTATLLLDAGVDIRKVQSASHLRAI
jgi:site-specific recombinase XerC